MGTRLNAREAAPDVIRVVAIVVATWFAAPAEFGTVAWWVAVPLAGMLAGEAAARMLSQARAVKMLRDAGSLEAVKRHARVRTERDQLRELLAQIEGHARPAVEADGPEARRTLFSVVKIAAVGRSVAREFERRARAAGEPPT